MSLDGSFRVALARTLNLTSRGVNRGYTLFNLLRAELMVALLPPQEWRTITLPTYARSRMYFSEEYNRTLFDWEESAIEAHFPRPPARILVGGAGGGREMAGLAQKGYDVAGLEPLSALAQVARRKVDPRRLLALEVVGYEELVHRKLRSIEDHAPYSAVVLGWTSIIHIGLEEDRRALFPKLRTLCPAGPVLLSYWPAIPLSPSRIRLRGLFARLGSSRRSDQDDHQPHAGFVHRFTLADLEGLGRLGGYELVPLVNAAFPSAVLRPG